MLDEVGPTATHFDVVNRLTRDVHLFADLSCTQTFAYQNSYSSNLCFIQLCTRVIGASCIGTM